MKRFQLFLALFLSSAAIASATVKVTTPKAGSTVVSPVQYTATATAPSCSKGVASMGVYVNNKLIYVVDKNSLNTKITLATGSQHTVVEEWDKCGKASVTTINLKVSGAKKPTVGITAKPASVAAGSPSTLTVTAANATGVVVTGSDKSSYTLAATGGTQVVTPAATTTYTATATGAGGTATAKATVTVTAAKTPTVKIAASPTTVVSGSSSTLTVTATNATGVTVSGTDGSSVSLPAAGGKTTVTPAATTTYTATAAGGGGKTAAASATVTVTGKTLKSVAVTPGAANFAMGTTQQFAATATYSDNSTVNVTSTATWSIANTAVATIASDGLATANAAGATTVKAAFDGVSGTAAFSVAVTPGTAVNVPTWHFDNNRSGLNANEASLTQSNVNAQSFGKMFSYLVDGYAYAQPLVVSDVKIQGSTRNVLYVATQYDSVYAFDADHYGTGAPLWKVSLLESGETPATGGPILPFEGVTSTPAIDLTTNTLYVVSKHHGSSGSFFRLSALDITTGAQKFGGPVTIKASVKASNSAAVDGVQTLTSACTQRSALLLAYGNVYFGFGSCHTGWLLGYDAQTLKQTGVFNASTELNGEGAYASAGGVWMGGGGPASNGDGNVYATTGNGPWDGKTAWSDSVLNFSPTLAVQDYFTPQMYQYMDCSDGDLSSGGLMLVPGTTQALTGGKLGYLYLVNTTNLGHEQAGDAGALWTGAFEPDLNPPNSKTCLDANGTNYTIEFNHYEVYGTPAYFNGSIYLGVTAEAGGIKAGLRAFELSGNSMKAGSYSTYGTQQEIRGTTPFVSANGTVNGIVWMLDQGLPLQSSATGAPTAATLRAFDPNNLAEEYYDSNLNAADKPGYGIKFTSPIVANGKVYISTGHDATTAAKPQGEIDVYGLN